MWNFPVEKVCHLTVVKRSPIILWALNPSCTPSYWHISNLFVDSQFFTSQKWQLGVNFCHFLWACLDLPCSSSQMYILSLFWMTVPSSLCLIVFFWLQQLFSVRSENATKNNCLHLFPWVWRHTSRVGWAVNKKDCSKKIIKTLCVWMEVSTSEIMIVLMDLNELFLPSNNM